MGKHVIDVREPTEFAQSHVAGAVNIPLGKIMSRPAELKEVSHDAEIVVYCRSGGRAASAATALQSQGYQNVTNGINQEEIERNS